MRPQNLRPMLVAMLLLSAATGCSQPNSPPKPPNPDKASSPQLKVVATFVPMFWFAKGVTGDKAEVEVLVPPGTEVHEYQATPGNVQAIARAKVLVKNGLGLEEFLEDTVRNAKNPNLKEIDASLGIQTLDEKNTPVISPAESPDKEDREHEKHSGDRESEKGKAHDREDVNPHVWLDPVLAKQQIANIRDGLIAADPNNKATYQTNAAAYIKQLEDLDNQFKQQLQKYPNCTFITFHNAFPYLTKRYQLQQIAVVEIPEDSLSPADVQKTIKAVKQYKVKALFGEPGVDNKLLQNLSKDLNLTVHTLDPLESGQLDPQQYFSAMKANLQTIEAACR